jgi:hypothetical protein
MNPWIKFLKEYRKTHKGEALKTSMKKAAVVYRAQKKGGKKKKKPGAEKSKVRVRIV